jgi:hypothetical protein
LPYSAIISVLAHTAYAIGTYSICQKRILAHTAYAK